MRKILKKGKIQNFQYELSSYKFSKKAAKLVGYGNVFGLGIRLENDNTEIYIENAKSEEEIIQRLQNIIDKLTEIKEKIL